MNNKKTNNYSPLSAMFITVTAKEIIVVVVVVVVINCNYTVSST